MLWYGSLPPPSSGHYVVPTEATRPLPVPPVGSKRAVQPATLGPAPRIDCGSCPSWRGGPTLFAQAASFLGRAGAHTSVDGLVRLAKAFPELPTERLCAMQSQQSTSHPAPKKAKLTIHGPS